MEHVAIMKKSWKLLPMILSREKQIESRGYSSKRAPWDTVKKGERIYFKNSGESVTVRARVDKVMQFSNLTPEKVREILMKYGAKMGLSNQSEKFYKFFKDKKYCILIFLKNPEQIKPFQINKNGFGLMSAWLSIKNINELKI